MTRSAEVDGVGRTQLARVEDQFSVNLTIKPAGEKHFCLHSGCVFPSGTVAGLARNSQKQVRSVE
jgi:hypothetical protein